jgi:Glycosyltransferase family 87
VSHKDIAYHSHVHRKSLAFAGVAIVAGLMVTLLCMRSDLEHLQTTDFVNLYAGARIVWQGQGSTLYTRQTQDAVLHAILGNGRPWQYFLHPPFEAAALSPLSEFTLSHAYVVWGSMNVVLLALIPIIISPYVPILGGKPYLGLLVFAFLPVIVALLLGQDSILLLVIFCVSYRLLAANREFPAGLVLALSAVKFQYLFVFAIMLLALRKFRMLLGVLLGVSALGLASLWITGLNGFVQYGRFLYVFNHHSGFGTLHPEVMVSWRGFLESVAPGSKSHIYAYVGELFLIVTGVLLLRSKAPRKRPDLAFAFATSLSLAASDYAHFPDLTVVIIPGFIAISYLTANPSWRLSEKLLATSCGIIFLWPMLVFFIAGTCCWIRYSFLSFPALLLFVGALAWNMISLSAGLDRSTRILQTAAE